jgi:hypothetical protein
MHNKLLVSGKDHYHKKRRRFYRWAQYYFFIFLWFGNVFLNHKHEALWLLKRCTLYILCTLILSKFFHITIGSSLTSIQNGLWVPKCCLSHFKVFFFLCLGFLKNVIKISIYCTPIILVIHHFFEWKVVHP